MAKIKPDNFLREALSMGATPLMFAGVFSLISNLLYLALPIYTNLVYSRVMLSQSGATLFVLTFGVLFVFVISTVMDVIRQQVLIDFGVVLDRHVSGRVFAALFDGVARRKISPRSQALRDLDQFRQMLTGQAVSILFDIPWVPIFIVGLFIINPWIGTVSLVGSLVLLLLAWMQDRATRRVYESGVQQSIDSYAFTDATLRNSEVVRALGMLQTLGSEWAVRRNASNERSARAYETQNVYSNIIKMLRMFVQVLIIAVGAWLIIEQKIASGLLFANMIVSARALQPIDRLVGSWNSLIGGKAAYDRLVVLLEDYEPPTAVTALPRPIGHLRVEQMGFAMPGAPRLLLSNVNFELQPGETLGVIGQSGAGKSTLARMLVGVWKPFSGHIRLDGAEVFAWDRTDFGLHAGYLPQDVELFSGTVRDNIARFRADATDAEVIEAARLANAHDLILSLAKGYDTELGEGGAVLSAGQRQRVGLARALFGSPAFVVLDEPNAALDTAGEEALMAALAGLKLRNVTVVIVSHKANIFRSADKMLYLKDGQASLFGPRDQVFAALAQSAASIKPAAPQRDSSEDARQEDLDVGGAKAEAV
jgi:ATP-binding cassette subfamily C exporter for protease/lipase